jgi:hypothetical protein
MGTFGTLLEIGLYLANSSTSRILFVCIHDSSVELRLHGVGPALLVFAMTAFLETHFVPAWEHYFLSEKGRSPYLIDLLAVLNECRQGLRRNVDLTTPRIPDTTHELLQENRYAEKIVP